MNIRSKMLLAILCICFLLVGCEKQSVIQTTDIVSVSIPNVRLYNSGVYYGTDLLSDTDIENIDVCIEYSDGTIMNKTAYIVYQTGKMANYKYIDLTDTEGKLIVTIKE